MCGISSVVPIVSLKCCERRSPRVCRCIILSSANEQNQIEWSEKRNSFCFFLLVFVLAPDINHPTHKTLMKWEFNIMDVVCRMHARARYVHKMYSGMWWIRWRIDCRWWVDGLEKQTATICIFQPKGIRFHAAVVRSFEVKRRWPESHLVQFRAVASRRTTAARMTAKNYIRNHTKRQVRTTNHVHSAQIQWRPRCVLNIWMGKSDMFTIQFSSQQLARSHAL